MRFGFSRRQPTHSPSLPAEQADIPPPPPRWRERLALAVLVLLSAWLIFTIIYRFTVLPYLLLVVLIGSLWRVEAGVLCLAGSIGILCLWVLREKPPPWQDGFEDMVRLTLLGLVAMGARTVLDGMERQRQMERRLLAELSRTVEQLRESEQRQAEAVQALEARNQELVAAQEQILRAERLAALGQFSATMAHELRNPLNVVKLSVRYITTRLGEPDEKLRRNITHANQSVDRACDIIDDLLTFSRLPPPRLQPTSINMVVREAIAALPVPARVTVEWALAPHLPPVAADVRQIEQAVGNLGLNALQAMGEGGRLTVGTRRVGDQVEITVTDTGPGIPSEMQERVFEPFFSTKVSGTGLGLPLVREIVEAHGGQFALRSAPGEGACFTLSLPLDASPPGDPLSPSHPLNPTLEIGREEPPASPPPL
jgi:signal transduction histidine kinase